MITRLSMHTCDANCKTRYNLTCPSGQIIDPFPWAYNKQGVRAVFIVEICQSYQNSKAMSNFHYLVHSIISSDFSEHCGVFYIHWKGTTKCVHRCTCDFTGHCGFVFIQWKCTTKFVHRCFYLRSFMLGQLNRKRFISISFHVSYSTCLKSIGLNIESLSLSYESNDFMSDWHITA